VPQVCDYIADFLRVSVPCIVNGTGDCITLVILEEETTTGVVGERTGMTKTVERFVFQFDITDDVVIGNCSSSSVSGIINIEGIDDLQKKEIIQRDADMATDARLQMERSMREVLLRTVAMRKRRRRPGEKAENMSFKLCLHIVEEYDENGKRKRDEYSCPDELLRVLKQGEWLVPDESSCYFPSSAFTSSVNSSSGSDDNGQNLRKGMLRPIKDISVPLCGMKLQLGMEVDPLT
jgi:hypothetical protein